MILLFKLWISGAAEIIDQHRKQLILRADAEFPEQVSLVNHNGARRNPELTQSVPGRPAGNISVPLVEDLPAADKTATELAREIERALSKFVRDPLVTVIVSNFVGVYQTQVRVVGQATEPRALPYRDNMTLLDVMKIGRAHV